MSDTLVIKATESESEALSDIPDSSSAVFESPDNLKTATSSSHHDSEYDTASDTPSSDLEDEDDFEDDDVEDNGDEGSVILHLDRQRLDGEEQDGEKKKVDDDEDLSNPQYIPKRGVFYEHDDRTADEPDAERKVDEEDRVVVPEKAIEIGIRSVFETAADAIRIAVPEELAYSHHYRACLGYFCETSETIVERSARRFAEEVALQVADPLHSQGKHCRLLAAADNDDTDVVIEVPVQDNNVELGLTNLTSLNSMHDSINSTISDWSLNNLLPNSENAVKEDQQHPLFDKTMLADVANVNYNDNRLGTSSEAKVNRY